MIVSSHSGYFCLHCCSNVHPFIVILFLHNFYTHIVFIQLYDYFSNSEYLVPIVFIEMIGYFYQQIFLVLCSAGTAGSSLTLATKSLANLQAKVGIVLRGFRGPWLQAKVGIADGLSERLSCWGVSGVFNWATFKLFNSVVLWYTEDFTIFGYWQ